MADMRKMSVTGRVGKTPEMLNSKSGTEYTRVSVACSENKRNSDGGWDNVTYWVSVVLYGKSAGYAVENLPAGAPVWATGDFELSVYKDKPQVTLTNAQVVPVLTKKLQAQIIDTSGGGGGRSNADDGWD